MTLTVLLVILETMDVAMVVAAVEATVVSILETEARVPHLAEAAQAGEMVGVAVKAAMVA